jgi:hypothetical protein
VFCIEYKNEFIRVFCAGQRKRDEFISNVRCRVQKDITLFGIPKAGSEAEIFWIDMCKFYRCSRVG